MGANGWALGKPNGKGGSGIPNSNAEKQYHIMWYYFSCGYDVNYQGFQCPHAKPNHIPNVARDKAHLVPGAIMKRQHKVLPDGSSASKEWIQTKGMNKAFYIMAKQG